MCVYMHTCGYILLVRKSSVQGGALMSISSRAQIWPCIQTVWEAQLISVSQTYHLVTRPQ